MTTLATWIREQLEYADALKMRAKDKEVVYLYEDALKILSRGLGSIVVDLDSASSFEMAYQDYVAKKKTEE